MRDGRRPCEHRRRREHATLVAQHLPPRPRGEQRVQAPEWGGRDMPESRGRVRVVAEATGQARMVERERDTDVRSPPRERLLECERELPRWLTARLQERVRAGCAKSRVCV